MICGPGCVLIYPAACSAHPRQSPPNGVGFSKVLKILFTRSKSFGQNNLYAVANVQGKFPHSGEDTYIVRKSRLLL